MEINLNVNDFVKVKLTDDGLKQYKNHLESYIPDKELIQDKIKHSKVKEGLYEFCIWELMQIFGKKMFCGSTEKMFEENRIIVP